MRISVIVWFNFVCIIWIIQSCYKTTEGWTSRVSSTTTGWSLQWSSIRVDASRTLWYTLTISQRSRASVWWRSCGKERLHIWSWVFPYCEKLAESEWWSVWRRENAVQQAISRFHPRWFHAMTQDSRPERLQPVRGDQVRKWIYVVESWYFYMLFVLTYVPSKSISCLHYYKYFQCAGIRRRRPCWRTACPLSHASTLHALHVHSASWRRDRRGGGLDGRCNAGGGSMEVWAATMGDHDASNDRRPRSNSK